MGILQCLDELCGSATQSLTGYITAHTRDFLLAGLLTFLGHRSLPFTKASLHATTKYGGFLPKRGHYPARKPAWRIRRSTWCLLQMMPYARLRQAYYPLPETPSTRHIHF